MACGRTPSPLNVSSRGNAGSRSDGSFVQALRITRVARRLRMDVAAASNFRHSARSGVRADNPGGIRRTPDNIRHWFFATCPPTRRVSSIARTRLLPQPAIRDSPLAAYWRWSGKFKTR